MSLVGMVRSTDRPVQWCNDHCILLPFGASPLPTGELQAVQVFDGRFFITVSQTPEETSRETGGRTFGTETKVHIKAHWFVSAGGHQPGIARESEVLPGRNLRSPVQETRRITCPANNRKDRAGWREGRQKQRACRNRCFQLRRWHCACEQRRILLLCCDNLASSMSFALGVQAIGRVDHRSLEIVDVFNFGVGTALVNNEGSYSVAVTTWRLPVSCRLRGPSRRQEGSSVPRDRDSSCPCPD